MRSYETWKIYSLVIQHVPWKGTILKGNAIFQPSIFNRDVSFQALWPMRPGAFIDFSTIHFYICAKNVYPHLPPPPLCVRNFPTNLPGIKNPWPPQKNIQPHPPYPPNTPSSVRIRSTKTAKLKRSVGFKLEPKPLRFPLLFDAERSLVQLTS